VSALVADIRGSPRCFTVSLFTGRGAPCIQAPANPICKNWTK